ncbi:MAG: proline iminopeptidase, partial [Scardovia wiggsiae]
MTLLDSYYVPGLYVEDHSVDVPLDWGGADGITAGSTGIPGGAGSGLKLFYRTVCAAGHAHD